MKFFFVLFVVSSVSSRGLPEDSVVSVYTTLPTTAGTSPSLDVYSQIATNIATNIADRITQPIYRLFNFNNKTITTTTTTKRPFEHIELLDEAKDNKTRDVEELSDDALRKPEKKPEKITLYSNYLPAKNEKLEVNDTIDSNEIDFEDFGIEDENDQESGRGPFVYIFELLGSIIQLLWGGFLAIFKPSTNERRS